MPKQVIHNATITLKLPLDMSDEAEVAALQAAGIPVDAIGNAVSGFLFVQFTRDWKNPIKIFRWFATDIG
jgi:hypothetical protein